MDTPPIPKPRAALVHNDESIKKPVPLPRTKLPAANNNERVTASDIMRSITTVSKQITEEVQTSAKSANDRIEKTILDGARKARGTLEKTLMTSRAVRDSLTRSVIEGTKTASIRLRKSKKSSVEVDPQSHESLPPQDISLFENIHFPSPFSEHAINTSDNGSTDCTHNPHLDSSSISDDFSSFSLNSEPYIDTASIISHDIKENDLNSETYDTPKSISRLSSLSYPDSESSEDTSQMMQSLRAKSTNSTVPYENWTIGNPIINPITTECKVHEEPTVNRSDILEFDPLHATSPTYEGVSNELLLLQSFLVGDLCGSIITNDKNVYSIEYYGKNVDFKPPTPPERSDSLMPNFEDAGTSSETSGSTWYEKNEHDEIPKVNPTTSVTKMISHMLKFDYLNKSPASTSQSGKKVEKPAVSHMPVIYHSGILKKVVTGVEELFKNTQVRYCVLRDQKLLCFADSRHTITKEELEMNKITSLQVVLPLSTSSAAGTYCFEIMCSASARSTPRKTVFSCSSATERWTWAQKILENLAYGFHSKHINEYTRCGWCYLKVGVSGAWYGAWLVLNRRVLQYYTTKDADIKTIDLRKTRSIVIQEADKDTKLHCLADGSPNLLLDCPDNTVYLRFPHERELKGWRFMVTLAAHNNGTHLHHQQLTKDDVPIIVEKCIAFLYAHGSLTEGIYRRAGSITVLTTLLTRFREDAWAVQLSPAEHSEHDITGVLKRFFRDLPEPLISKNLNEKLIAAMDITDNKMRYAQYHTLMSELPSIQRKTARKLFAHLFFLHSLEHYNKMSAINLASIWTPTIMTGMSNNVIPTLCTNMVMVVKELISEYEAVWKPTEDEKRREAAVKHVLQRVIDHTVPSAQKAAGDLRVWVYVNDKNTCFQVTLTPSKTSADICLELHDKAKTEPHLLMLEEVVCGGNMKRIIHINEIVLDVVIRWGYWDDDDRKDNYLLVTENNILHNINAMKSSISLVFGELKFANESSKTFKQHMFEIKNMKLSYFKDKQGSQQIDEWLIEDIVWYVGHESRRNPQTRWSITFIPKKTKPKRTKDSPWFGCTIAGAVSEDQLRWIAALMAAEHSDLLPIPRLIIT